MTVPDLNRCQIIESRKKIIGGNLSEIVLSEENCATENASVWVRVVIDVPF